MESMPQAMYTNKQCVPRACSMSGGSYTYVDGLVLLQIDSLPVWQSVTKPILLSEFVQSLIIMASKQPYAKPFLTHTYKDCY